MRNIMEILYDCFLEVDYRGTPERRADTGEYAKLREQVKETFGPDFVDRLTELHELRLGYQGLDHFSAGFRAGVRLMLEALTSATV